MSDTSIFAPGLVLAVQIFVNPEKRKKEKNLQSPCFFFFSISNKPPRRSKFGTASNRDWKTRPAVPFYFQGYADYIVYTDNIFPTLLKNEAIKSVRRERI
jgi:hypothetical protein